MERVELLPFRGEATGENLCVGQRQVADACAVAGSVDVYKRQVRGDTQLLVQGYQGAAGLLRRPQTGLGAT